MVINLFKYETKLINNEQYVKACESSQIYDGRGVKIQFPEDEDFQVAILRIDGKLYCMDNICPHRHLDKIYDGIIKNHTVMCPAHGWTYNVKTGENMNKHQGLKSLNVYDVFEKEGDVFIEKPDFEVPKWRQF